MASAGTISLNLTSIDKSTLLAGKTRLTLVLENASTQLSLQVNQRRGKHGGDPTIVASQRNGILANLYNAQAVSARLGESIIDMRTFPAGTFSLEVYNPFAARAAPAISYTLSINPPAQGEAHLR